MCPASGYAKIIRHCMKQESGHLFTLSAYQHLLGTERSWALDNVLQELGRERTIAMSCRNSSSRCLWQHSPTICYWRRAALLSVLQSTPPTAVGCSSLPFDESQQKKLEVPFTLLWINGTAIIRRSSGYGKPLKILRVDGITESYETRPYFTIKCKKL